MKTSKKIVSLLLAIILCFGTAFAVSSAQQDIAQVSATSNLMPIGSDVVYSDLEATVGKDISLPSKYSSKDLGYVSPVRQQTTATCWAFGSLSTFETALLKNNETVESSFAPQHENFWGSIRLDGTGWQRSETGGGYSYIPLGYLTSWGGPVYENSFPIDSDLIDYLTEGVELTPQYGLTEAIYFDSSASDESIKALIYKYGAVVASFNADPQYLVDQKNYYCNNDSITMLELMGHCISVVGWDDSYAKENFTNNICGTPKNNGAWLIKNSWGEGINDIGGFFWVSYEDVWIFDQIFGPSYAFSKYEKITDNKKLYQNETYGATYQFSYITSEQYNPYEVLTYINVFDFTESDRILDKVVFETLTMYADYKVSYVPIVDGKPDTNQNNWNTLYTGTVDHTGYICVDVENITLPAGKGGIAITIDNEKAFLDHENDPGYEYIDNSIGVDEWLKVNGNYIFIPDTNKGNSFFIRGNGTMYELMDFYKTLLNDDIGGTFVIKAITSNPDNSENTQPATVPETTTATVPATTAPATSTAPTTANDPATTSPISSNPAENTTFDPGEILEIPLGDGDGNGVVNIKDATLIQKSAAGLVELDARSLVACDVNGDKNVNVLDATVIQKFVAGMSVKYNVGSIKVFIP